MSLEFVLAYDKLDDIRLLFEEYTKMLIMSDATSAECLLNQNYDVEIKCLTEKYGLPNGRLYLALYDGKNAGCIAMRALNDDCCEMKRLYVKPDFRGLGIAESLVNKIMNEAKKIGYQQMFLDTMPFLTGAINLYKKLGFYEIDSYNDNPLDNAIFMQKHL